MNALFAVIALFTLISGCTKENQPYRTALLGTKIKNFDPVGLNEYNEVTLISQICGRLTAVDEALNIEGDLAESWEISDDRKTVIFKVKTDRHFPDGSEVKASDVKFSIQRVQSVKKSLAASWSDEIKSVDAISENQVQVVLTNANPRILYLFSHPRFCILKEKEPLVDVNGIKTPNSPGAYRVTDIKDDQVHLSINSDFLRHSIEKSIVVRFLDQNEAIKEFNNGQLNDLSFYILSDKELTSIKPEAKKVESRIFWTWFILLNPNTPLFKSMEQRKQFIEGINRDEIFSNWKTDLIRSVSVIPQGMKGYSEVVESHTNAKRFECRGKSLRIATIEGLPSTDSLYSELRRQIQQMKNCKVDIVPLEMGTFMKEYEAKSYDMYIVGIDTNSTDPLGFYRQFIEGESENFLKFKTNRLSSLYKTLYSETPENRHQTDYDNIQKEFYREYLGIPLGHPVFKFVYQKDVTALHMNALGMHLNRWRKIGRKP